MTRDCSKWLSDEGFSIIDGKSLIAKPSLIRDSAGVYMIFVSKAADIFQSAGIADADLLTNWSLNDHQHVYTGESVAMKSRVLLHLLATIRDSSLREFVLSLQFSNQVLWPERIESLFTLENKLTNWLVPNVYVAFRSCSYIADVEKRYIQMMLSPFNVKHNKDSRFLVPLKNIREKFRAHLRHTEQRQKRISMPPSYWLDRANHFGGFPTQSTRPLS